MPFDSTQASQTFVSGAGNTYYLQGRVYYDAAGNVINPLPATLFALPVPVSGITVNPTSVLTRPSDTNAYSVGDLIASSTTAGSIVVPSVSIARLAAGSGTLVKAILYSNHTTGLSGISVTANLWTAAPTYTNGDNGAYAVATGAAGFLGSLTGSFKQFGDGAAVVLTHDSGVASLIKLAAGQIIFWDLQANAAFTPQSGKTFTLVPQFSQD